jgi:hypothetical protein
MSVSVLCAGRGVPPCELSSLSSLPTGWFTDWLWGLGAGSSSGTLPQILSLGAAVALLHMQLQVFKMAGIGNVSFNTASSRSWQAFKDLRLKFLKFIHPTWQLGG